MKKIIILLFAIFMVIPLTLPQAGDLSRFVTVASAAEPLNGQEPLPTSMSNFLERPEIKDAIDANNKSEELQSKGQRKMSSDLNQLLDDNIIPAGKTRQELTAEMRVNNQYQPAQDISPQSTEVDERVYVYIYLNSGTDIHAVDDFIQEATDRDEKNDIVVAWVEVSKLQALASDDQVRLVQTVIPPRTNMGSRTTEGVAKQNVDKVLSKFNQNGDGMKIGVISDGVDYLSSAVASGDLPSGANAVTVLHNTSNSGNQSEGVAMLEIIYDMAPGAKLYFHDAGANYAAFNTAIDQLVAAGCNVIVDDISWISQPFFEDGEIAQHVTNVINNNNIIYVSSAGNSGSAHYQGTYTAYSSTNTLHKYPLYFDVGPGENTMVILEWNDKFGSSSNNYDLHLFNADTGSELAYSKGIQSGSGNPFEGISYTNNTSSTITIAAIVNKYSAVQTKTLEIYIYGGSLYTNNLTKTDSIFGHAAVPGAIAVGSVDLTAATTIRPYSSLGPVTISYPSSTSRSKPDICGVDGVAVTGAGGFSNPFYGTSAAAPHVAAVAALLWAKNPGKTGNQIRDLLKNNAKDLGLTGYDTTYGYGMADAMKVFMATMANTCFSTSVTKYGGESVSISSTGNAANEVWFAPSGTTTFTQGATMTKAAGDATSIAAPLTSGTYKLYLIVDGVASTTSTATLTVSNSAPTLSTSNPTASATGVALSVAPTFTFNQAIQQGTKFSTITLKDSSSNAIAFTASISGSILTITPTAALSNSKQYTVTVPAGAVKSLGGTATTSASTLIFTTVAATAPTVTVTSPTTGATAVSIASVPSFTYNQTLLQGTTFASITLKDSNNNAVAFTASISDSVLAITPSAPLNYSTAYTLTAPAGAVKSVGGIATTSAATLTFTTESRPETPAEAFGFDASTGTITSYSGTYSDIVIPEKINGVAVKNIGDYVFSACSDVTSITLPSSLVSIGEGAFSGCTKLTAITASSDNANYSSTNGVLFNKNKTTIVKYPEGKSDSTYTIPSGVTNIGEDAFAYCEFLTGVTLLSGITSIGDHAFAGCSGLTGITLPTSVTSIGAGAFKMCTGFTSITIPSNVTSIGDYALAGCSGLSAIAIPASVIHIGAWPFVDCSKLTAINVNSSNTNYSSTDGVLFNKDKTTIITYPQGKIGSAYTIPSGVTTISEAAFYRSGSLTDILITNGVTIIGGSAFYECHGLTDITIPSSVTAIGSLAFAYCQLTRAYFKGNAPATDVRAFDNNAAGFTIYYKEGATDFTTPTWLGYPTQVVPLNPPVLSATHPAVGTTGVPREAAPTFSFNQNILQGASYGAITLKDSSNNAIPFTASITGSVLTVSPTALLSYGTQYTVIIPAGALKSFSDDAIKTAITLTFTTLYDIPPAPVVTADDVSNVIVGLDLSTMEYAISADGGQFYGSYTSSQPTAFGGNKVIKVRVKAQGAILAGVDTILSFTPNYGDVNGDGPIDITDVIMCAEIVVDRTDFTPNQIARANVSDKNDPTVDISDVVLIAERAVTGAGYFPIDLQ